MKLKTKWLIYAVSGLLLVGAGLSVIGEAVLHKGAGAPFFWLGTAGLVLFNAGLSLFGQAVVYRTKM
ncbi:hypothetical protein N9N85_03395 [Schleiferiaceae bacterium]|jgi:hypothetical protein|nr:hypothetical protein [Schleiferiaceae bacterium]